MALKMEILDSKATQNKRWEERNMSIENVLDTKTKMEHRIVRLRGMIVDEIV